MNVNEARPRNWTERHEDDTFAARLALSREEYFMAPLAAALITAPGILHYLVFDFISDEFVRHLIPLTWITFSVPFWIRAFFVFFPVPHFLLAKGRITFINGQIPVFHRGSVSAAEVVDVSRASRKMQVKHSEFDVWDVVLKTRDGASQVVRLSLISEKEAGWVARRLKEVLAAGT